MDDFGIEGAGGAAVVLDGFGGGEKGQVSGLVFADVVGVFRIDDGGVVDAYRHSPAYRA